MARIFEIPESEIHSDMAYGSSEAWDSLNHVNLMLALEAEYGIEVDEELMLELTELAAIRRFLEHAASENND